ALLVVEPGDQHFGLKRADALRREVHHADHLAADQLLLAVERDDLRARHANADLGAEVDAQLPGRLARFRKVQHLEDRADAQLDPLEVSPLDEIHKKETVGCRLWAVARRGSGAPVPTSGYSLQPTAFFFTLSAAADRRTARWDG